MAEVVAGLMVTEQVVSTAISGGAIAGYALNKPTLPLKATFTCIGNSPTDISPDSLARSSHSANVVDGDLYIYGGKVAQDRMAGDEMHILKLSNAGGLGAQYKATPALSRDDGDVPAARAGHTACVVDGKIVMFGGYGSAETREPLTENGRVWVFDPSTLHWHALDPINETPSPQRCDHSAVAYNHSIIIHGGYSSESTSPETDTWHFDIATRTWSQLPALNPKDESPSMIPRAPPCLALANNELYLVAGSSDLGSQLHILDLSAADPAWRTVVFPTNPLTPGPSPRKGAGILPVGTGMGRTYLVFMFGAKDAPNDPDAPAGEDADDFYSGLWALQVPSTAATPAQAKDATRETMGMSSREAEWAEVEVIAAAEERSDIGKAHPGPRGYFACDVMSDQKLVFWGGLNPKGTMEGDGWFVELQA